MKYFLQSIFLMLLVTALVAFTQKDDIVAALKTGSVEKMSKYFDNTVDVTLPGKSNSFSKGQADDIDDWFGQICQQGLFARQDVCLYAHPGLEGVVI